MGVRILLRGGSIALPQGFRVLVLESGETSSLLPIGLFANRFEGISSAPVQSCSEVP